MTGDGMCGVFIPDRVLAGWWRSQWKASDRMWAGRCTTGCGRGQVYKCQCGWDHCSVLGGCLHFLSLCSSGFQDLLRLKPPSLLKFSRIVSVLDHCHFYTKIQREMSENVFTNCVINACDYACIYKELF